MKSGITEAMLVQAMGSIAVIVFQLIQGQPISQVAITTLVTSIGPIMLRSIHKNRGG